MSNRVPKATRFTHSTCRSRRARAFLLAAAACTLATTASARESVLYWADGVTNAIQRTGQSGIETLVTEAQVPAGVAFDPENQTLYWLDIGSRKLWRANVDGTEVTQLADELPLGIRTFDGQRIEVGGEIALDLAGGKIYWSALESITQEPVPPFPVIVTAKIQRADLDGSNIEDVITGLPGAGGVAVACGKLYWTTFEKLQTAHVDGTGIDDVLTGLTNGAGPLTIDDSCSKLYWLSSTSVERANLDGSEVEQIVPSVQMSAGRGIAVDSTNGRVYWTESAGIFAEPKIRRANLDGSEIQDVTTDFTEPRGVVLDPANDSMYWTDIGGVRSADLAGANSEYAVPGVNRPLAIAFDSIEDRMYWTEFGFGSGRVRSADLDGFAVEDLATDVGDPQDIAVDPVDRKLYWTEGSSAEGGRIWRSDLDGSKAEKLLTGLTGPSSPEALALDIITRKLFWADRNAISRSDLDGSSAEVAIEEGATSLTIDPSSGKLCWAYGGTIQCATTDGENVQELYSAAVQMSVNGIAIDSVSARIYWTESEAAQLQGPLEGWIRSAELDGSDVVEEVSGLVSPQGLTVVPEPGSRIALVAALATLGLLQRRRRH